MDIGLERAGWQTAVATDIDGDCVATLEASKAAGVPVRGRSAFRHLHDAAIVKADVCDLVAADLRPAHVTGDWRPSLLAGGPPCQPWSSAGLQQGLRDARGQLFEHLIRLTDELRPHFVLFENVRGLVTAVGPGGRPGEVLELIQRSFEDLGYATTFATLNAADYGAPQRRVRLFMMASDTHALPAFPEPTRQRSIPAMLDRECEPWVSLGEFLNGLPRPAPAEVMLANEQRGAELAALVPGTGLRTRGRVENNRPGGHWGYRQDFFLADPALPARTIRAAGTPDWIRLPDGSHRRLTWRECAALQGFPPGWRFEGRIASKFRQIGNAVQADAAEALGGVLLGMLAGGPSKTTPRSVPLPSEFGRRVKYTVAEHRTNGEHRVRVRASVA